MIHNDFYSLERSVTTKKGFADLVTKSDTKIEKFLFGHIKEKFPSHKFVNVLINKTLTCI